MKIRISLYKKCKTVRSSKSKFLSRNHYLLIKPLVCELGQYSHNGGQSGVQFQVRARDFHLLQNVQTRSGIHTASYFMHRGGSIPGVKHLQCEFNQSLPTSVKIKNKWHYNSTPPICIHSMDMDNLTSTLICVCVHQWYTQLPQAASAQASAA